MAPDENPQDNVEQPPNDEVPFTEAPPEFFLQAESLGVTEEAAYEDAVALLAVSILGDDSRLGNLGVRLHDRAIDPVRSEPTEDGQVRVLVGLTRERVSEGLAAIEARPPPDFPSVPFADRLRQIYGGYLRHLVCYRRLALLQAGCEPPPAPFDVDEQVEALVRVTRLRPLYREGLPLDQAGGPLRPLSAIAEHDVGNGTWRPLAQLPMRVQPETNGEALSSLAAVTDELGVARFPFAQGATFPEGGLRVVIDRERLLGPLSEIWPVQEVQIAGRRVSTQRWGLVATVHARGQTVRNTTFASNLELALRRNGAQPAVRLDPRVLQELSSTPLNLLPARLSALADTMAGQVDVLMRVEVTSDFASRMGAHRVWYEARGRAEAFDLWTGRRLTTVETTSTTSGLGDEAADQAAQQQLASQLAESLLTSLTRDGAAPR